MAEQETATPYDLIVITPCFNDWEALRTLLPALAKTLDTLAMNSLVLVVNDGGAPPPDAFPEVATGTGLACELLTLHRNLGHQRAITVGLAHVEAVHTCKFVVVMDADGEDAPEQLPALVAAAERTPGRIVFAQRTRRSESLPFRIGYRVYKWLFWLLTAERVSFGNFSLVPAQHLKRLVSTADLWTHYAAGILRAKLPYATVPLPRAARYVGRTRMNPESLVLHGLAAISLYSDVAAVRVLLATTILALAGMLAIGTATAIRLFTDLATPGWATNVVGLAAMLVIQGISLSLLLVFVGFQQRTATPALPRKIYRDYIEKVERLGS